MTKQTLVNGREVTPAQDGNVVEVQPGVYSVLFGGKSYTVRATRSGPGHALSGHIMEVRGHILTVEVQDPRDGGRTANQLAAGGPQKVVASMPGKVVRVLVALGDTVEPGQGLVVVEAMKMQNEIKAAKAGKVAQLLARDGHTVTAGEVLLVIE